MEEQNKQQLTLMNRVLGIGTPVDLTMINESGETRTVKGKIRGFKDMGAKKYFVHIKNTETVLEVQDVKVDEPEELEGPFAYLSGAYDKYGRPIL